MPTRFACEVDNSVVVCSVRSARKVSGTITDISNEDPSCLETEGHAESMDGMYRYGNQLSSPQPRYLSNVAADSSQFIGVKVVSKLSQEKEGTPVPTELCSLAFAVFLEESASLASFHYAPAVPAAYVSLSHLLTSAGDQAVL